MLYKYDGKHIHVSCAIIERNGLVLAARRSEAMVMPGKWEFPGGKVKRGEDPADCLLRELVEEMGIGIAIKRTLAVSTHAYPTFTVTLHPFVCTIVSGEITLSDHDAVAWLPPEELTALDWCEADPPVIAAYRQSLVDRETA